MGEMWGKSADLDCEWGGMQLAGVRGCPPQTLEKVWRTLWGLPDAGQRPSPGRQDSEEPSPYQGCFLGGTLGCS